MEGLVNGRERGGGPSGGEGQRRLELYSALDWSLQEKLARQVSAPGGGVGAGEGEGGRPDVVC